MLLLFADIKEHSARSWCHSGRAGTICELPVWLLPSTASTQDSPCTSLIVLLSTVLGQSLCKHCKKQMPSERSSRHFDSSHVIDRWSSVPQSSVTAVLEAVWTRWGKQRWVLLASSQTTRLLSWCFHTHCKIPGKMVDWPKVVTLNYRTTGSVLAHWTHRPLGVRFFAVISLDRTWWII